MDKLIPLFYKTTVSSKKPGEFEKNGHLLYLFLLKGDKVSSPRRPHLKPTNYCSHILSYKSRRFTSSALFITD